MKQQKLTFTRSSKRKMADLEEKPKKENKMPKIDSGKNVNKLKQKTNLVAVQDTVAVSPVKNNSSSTKKFSNSMKDAVKTLCKICSEAVSLTTMRGHTKGTHKMSIAEYKEKYGNHRTQMIEEVYHECGLCKEAILLDSDDIAHHLKKCHQITHKDYNSRFMTLIKNDKTPKAKAVPQKKKAPTKFLTKPVKLEVKFIDEPKKILIKDINDNEAPEIETEVFEKNSNSSDDSHDSGIVDDKDDSYEAGPSSGKRMTDEQREEHLWKLHMIQRNMLRRHYFDDEDYEEEEEDDTVDSDSYSRSA